MASVVTVAMFLVSMASYAYGRLGLDAGWALVVLFGSVLSSWCNIPMARLRGRRDSNRCSSACTGWSTSFRRAVRSTKIIATNVSGAIIPATLSMYLIINNDLRWQAIAGISAVAIVTYSFARIIPGVGIVVPTLIPPITAALTAWIIDLDAVAALPTWPAHWARSSAVTCSTCAESVSLTLLSFPSVAPAPFRRYLRHRDPRRAPRRHLSREKLAPAFGDASSHSALRVPPSEPFGPRRATCSAAVSVKSEPVGVMWAG